MSERDIVDRLRARRPRHNQVSVDAGLFTEIDEAAAEILRLRAELAARVVPDEEVAMALPAWEKVMLRSILNNMRREGFTVIRTEARDGTE